MIIPYSQRIRFHAINNRRNPDMLYDMVKSHAALFFMQRKKKTSGDGTSCVYADEADFTSANEVFTLLNGTAGGQESKMTRREADLLGAIREADQLEYTIQDLQRLTGSSYSGIYKSLKGYESRGKNYTGLLEKCPALSFTDRTVTTLGEDGNTVRRRTEAYAWDRELYRQWNGGGACWLDPARMRETMAAAAVIPMVRLLHCSRFPARLLHDAANEKQCFLRCPVPARRGY